MCYCSKFEHWSCHIEYAGAENPIKARGQAKTSFCPSLKVHIQAGRED